MVDDKIIYTEMERKTSYSCNIFHIDTLKSKAPDGHIESFTSIECGNFAIVIPILRHDKDDAEVLMVSQWRHACACESLEFPGGMLNDGETPAAGAARECREETGFLPQKMTFLGELAQNPAILNNRYFVYLAEDLKEQGGQELDRNEYISVKRMKLSAVFANIGEPPLISGLMAAALCMLQKRMSCGKMQSLSFAEKR